MNRRLLRVPDLPRLAGSATAMYVAALAMSGLAVLLTVALPPHERGRFVATTTSATLAVAAGGLSLETFLLAQGRPWLLETAGRRSFAVYAATVPLSAGLSWLFATYSGQASPGIAAAAAVCIAAGTIPAAAGLTMGGLRSVYRYRAAFATAAPVLYVVLILTAVRDVRAWLLSWLGCQALMAVAMWIRHGRPLLPMLRRSSIEPERLTRLGLTHVGALAYIFTYRFDQLALSRYQGPGALALYSLAMNAVEFAQAGAVVQAQRALGDHEEGAARRLPGLLRTAVYLGLGLGVVVLVGLAGIGTVAPAYQGAFVLGLLLLPRGIAVGVDRVLGGRLVNLGRERTTAVIAGSAAVLAVLTYPLVAARFGTAGVALVSVALFTGHGVASGLALRSGKPRPGKPRSGKPPSGPRLGAAGPAPATAGGGTDGRG